MPSDANIALQASVTKTATFNGAALVLPGGTPRRGLVARVIYSAASASAGDTITFSVDVCYDGVPTVWNSDFVAPAITLPLSSAPGAGEIFIPFSISPTSVANGTQVRLTATFSSTAHTDTITYAGDIVAGRP
jgi:hypothetical protein